MDYMTLIAEHDRIESLCDALLLLVSNDPRPEVAIGLLHDLAQTVGEHLAKEDRLIYVEMWPSDDPDARRNARLFADKFTALASDCSLYLTEWTNDAIAADWSTFREQSLSVIARVRDRVRHENTLLYPAAFRAGHMTLRPADRIQAVAQ